jgi:hypothetical protein
VQALVRPRREGPAMLLLTVPAKMRGDDVEALLETARALIAELTLSTNNPRHLPRRRQSCANGGLASRPDGRR